MTDSHKAFEDLLRQVLDEYGSAIDIDGGSKILASDTNIARAIAEATESIRTPFGPIITIAARQPGIEDASKVPGVAKVEPIASLPMDHFTHAIFAVNAEDPKFIYAGLKQTKYSLQPKGLAIVLSLKQAAGQVEGQDDTFTVALEDKIQYQSRGKAGKLTDVLEFAGFETGKIRSFDRTTEAGGQKREAEILFARKWDQLTA